MKNIHKNKAIWSMISVVTSMSLVAAIPLTVIGLKTGFLRSRAAGANASLIMPASSTLQVGNTFLIPININTDGANVRGVDVSLKFDPTVIKLIAANPGTVTQSTLKTFLPVNNVGQFNSANIIYNANLSGSLSFSAISFDYANNLVLSPFNGVGLLMNLQFQALKAGSTKVEFVFAPASTTDTNIVSDNSTPTDLLSAGSQLTNASITVSPLPTATPVSTTTPMPSSTPVATIVPTIAPTPRPTSSPTVTPVPTQPPTPVVTSVILRPTEDTYINSSSAGTNYGNSQTLYVDGSPIKKTYMKFNLSEVSGKVIKSAKLRFRTTSGEYSGSPNRTNILISDNINWSESSLNYSNTPVLNSYLMGSIENTTSNATNEIGLTASALQSRAGKVVTIIVDPAGEDALYFYSRESSYRPELILEFENANSSIIVWAAGTKGGGVYPSMDLLIKDLRVKTFASVEGNPSTRYFQAFSYTHSTKVLPSDIKVKFTNDYRSWDGDRNLVVDKITIDGVDYQSESSNTYGTGVWTRSTGCTTGNLQTEWLYCNGYFRY